MIEFGESNIIEDKEYLKNYDLVDIPGVLEFRKLESEKNVEKPQKEEEQESAKIKSLNTSKFCTIEGEISYNVDNEHNCLTEIFKIIKDKIKNGIIVFSIDKFESVDNYRIIRKLQKVINRPLKTF